MRLGGMAGFEIFKFFLSEKQNRGILFECPLSLQETAMVERSRKSRPTAVFRAKQRGADELRRRSRACPEMAPQELEKIESAPENGMVSEASNPQHLVHGRVAHHALRRNSLGAPPTSQRPEFTNSKRRKADGKFSASQPLGIAQNRKRISEALTAQRPRSTNSTRENAARKIIAEEGA
jgi:hypothetical protein